MTMLLKKELAAVAVLIGSGVCAPPANAALALTTDGINLGFSLTTFATINPGNTGFGTFGLTIAANGNVITSNYYDSTRYTFADVDGQTTATALTTQLSDSSTSAYANAGGQAYGASGGRFAQFKSDGSVDHVLTNVGAFPYLGMWGNPANGHLIATSYSGLIDIDPLANAGAGSYRVIANVFGDGVSVSPDGKTAFLETTGGFTTYDIATGATGYTVGGFAGADGTGVITSNNALNGDVVVNTNYGSIYLYDPSAKTSTLLASGGTRGDYVAADTSNGTLLLDYSDIIARLGCGTGCGVGAPPPPVPEPDTYALMLMGLGTLGFWARRKPQINAGV